ncbi:uncharacterized protein [Ptychodera flava]|uniref:uncharacterized protein n=1 Tax=Ptychodera flava TaxID=63121 RepID=UPI00396A3A26
MTMTSYEPEEPLIGDSGNFDYIRRYCSDEYQSTGFFCSDYLSVAEQCIHVCFDDGCTYRKNDCASRNNITDPISCISCEYNSEAPDSDKECLTDPYSRGTITCNSKCVTFGHSQTGKQWVYRGCDCNDQYTWTGSCKRVKIGQSDFANICTCDSENFCNADDTGNHLCYQCDSRKDRDCYTDLQRNVPSPCLAGHSGCVTEMMAPYEEFTTSHGSSSFDYVTRYCGEENYGDDGNCIDFLGTSLLCYFSCKTDGCNDDSGCRPTSALNDQHYIVIVVLLWLSSAVG